MTLTGANSYSGGTTIDGGAVQIGLGGTTGSIAGDVARKYEEFVEQAGMKEYYLYGPCHGLGMIEVEKPWLETSSKYALQPNMTFQADTFFADKDFGLRWENGLRVTESGKAEMLNSGARMDIIEIDC